ncbi:type II secretion system protein GspM [Rhizomicrobium electricum]
MHQKALALALALVPGFALIAGLWVFVSAQIDRHIEASLLVRELTRQRALLALAPAQHKKLLELRSSPDWQALFIAKSSTTPDGPLSAVVKTNGGKVQSDTVARQNAFGATEIDEHIVFTADTQQLAHILLILRGRRPLFVIRALEIQHDDPLPTQARRSINVLTINLTVAEFEHP